MLLCTAGSITGCGWSPDIEWRSGQYIVQDVDARGQMDLGVDVGNGTSFTLVGPTVFSIGADDRYIVVKQHPGTDAFGHFDRSATHYFIVDRSVRLDPPDDPSAAAMQKAIRGPLGEANFKKLSATLALPAFTITFDDLV
jgi:hypothetical protein